MYSFKKKLPQQIIYSGKPHVCLVFTQENYLFFLFFLEWSTAAEIRSTEERLLFNLTTQPGLCAPRGDDPYKSVSVYAEAAMIPLLGKFSLKAHVEGSQSKPDSRGGKMSWHCHCQIYFLVSAVGCGTVGLYSFTLSLSRSGSVHFEFGRPICPAVCEWMWANQYWNLSPPSLSLSFFISCDARNTHQGAVVQESRGEVAVEAERQDVSFPAANSHFVLWQGWDSSEKTVVCYYSDDLNPQEKEAVTSSEPEAQSQVRSLKWALCHSGVISEWKRGIITVQPGHAGVMNFELFTLQILHGEMGAEQQVRFIFRGNETGVN